MRLEINREPDSFRAPQTGGRVHSAIITDARSRRRTLEALLRTANTRFRHVRMSGPYSQFGQIGLTGAFPLGKP